MRAVLLDLCPEGFEEVDSADEVELAAFVDEAGEKRLRFVLGRAETTNVPPGWEDAWRSFHRPVRVGSLWVGPPWERPAEDAVAIVIDPGRAFGTGAHPTTRLCLELLLDEARTGLLDLGCGSGVLAIAGAKLGFAPVVALDRDEAAVDASRRNALANGVELEVRLADAFADPLPAVGVVLANVDRNLVARVAERLPAGRLIASGYLAAEAPSPAGWSRLDRRQTEGWAADLFARR
jgi:ribosomal protein L11 methyltransferase